ncbi:MICOS complex subunit MIC13 [Scomber scombrus]|uniref:MICOS complex subunit MIC13 n=1 Tax=Scomber scombrus TaxID=13677 RepID=A0AAV1N7U0_SCOSC
MAARILPVIKLATKVTIAGGAVYVAYDSGLLGSSEQGSVALEKAKAVVPPAVEEWMKYFGLERNYLLKSCSPSEERRNTQHERKTAR